MNDMTPHVSKLSDVTDRIVPRKLAHFVLRTANFQAMVDWYLTVLNARVALKSPHLVFMTYDDEHHRVAIIDVPRLSKNNPNTCGLDHIAFTFGSLPELLTTYRRLKKAGIEPRFTINHGVTTSFYYEDPDGGKIELQIDNFATDRELQTYFETDPGFAKNPLGAPFDPEKLIADMESGASLETLLTVPEYPAGLTPRDIIEDMGIGSRDV